MAHIILPSMHIPLDFSGEYTPLVCNQDEIHRDFNLCLQEHCFLSIQSVLFIFIYDPHTQSLDLIPTSTMLKDAHPELWLSSTSNSPPEYPAFLLVTHKNLQVIPSAYHRHFAPNQHWVITCLLQSIDFQTYGFIKDFLKHRNSLVNI